MTPYDLAGRYIGLREIPGEEDNPLIVAMLRLAAGGGTDANLVAAGWPSDDETAWCAAFVAWIAWHFGVPLPRKALRARSWLTVGKPEWPHLALPGWTIAVLRRGSGAQPGPDVLDAPGHVGLFGGTTPNGTGVWVLGGNQGDAVNVTEYPAERLLGIRRLGAIGG